MITGWQGRIIVAPGVPDRGARPEQSEGEKSRGHRIRIVRLGVESRKPTALLGRKSVQIVVICSDQCL
ncbi:hypothetical protein AMEX_G8525 [Astyanax mexicanus]|uniref:Uncharacterized protein n=1 Tax=Astyanax mexicanus TaxID=7994 RepID=A0A8T2M2I4_ASTMX|nr:hypothetical protein AMEX_G8525 [Astyanax mexicanus]